MRMAKTDVDRPVRMSENLRINETSFAEGDAMSHWKQAGSFFITLIAIWHLNIEQQHFGITVQVRMASVCVTPYLQCPLTVPTPVGSPCSCMTPQGVFSGIAN